MRNCKPFGTCIWFTMRFCCCGCCCCCCFVVVVVVVVVVVLVVAGRSNTISNQVKILILSVFPIDPNT